MRTGRAFRHVLLLATFALPGTARADALNLPEPPLHRDSQLTGSYQTDAAPSRAARLDLAWTDDAGRLVMQEHIAVPPGPARQIPFRLDLRHAVTSGNHLRAELHVADSTQARVTERDFVVRPPAPWRNFEAILWQPQSAAAYAALPALGITAGKVFGTREGDPAAGIDQADAMRKAGLRWYVENIATDFYAAYHRWQPDQAVNARFAAVQRLHRQDPAALGPFMRDPSLSDPAWHARIATRLAANVRAWRRENPLFYNLGDETGIADLAAPWDFDFSPIALAQFRRHLAAEYGTLAALNAEWGTGFRSWQAVTPMTTDQAMARPGDNFAPWADFKAWMDTAFADALLLGTRSVHQTDPTALAGIEGAQVPGWGGYDYSRLAHAVDLVEAYSNSDNVELLRALNPNLVVLMTMAGFGAADFRALWHEVLLGIGGVILWDEKGDIVGADGKPGAWGTALQPVLAELAGGLGATLAASTPETGRVGILYSPPSFRVEWILRLRPGGPGWADRGAAREYDEDTPWRAAMRRSAELLTHLGIRPRWLTPASLAADGLTGLDALILPQSLALSRGEVAAIRHFMANGGRVLADGVPGRFDAHGRAVPPPFPPPGTTGSLVRDLAPLLRNSAVSPDASVLDDFAALLGHPPPLALLAANGQHVTDVQAYLFRNGTTTLLGLQREPAASGSENLALVLPRPVFATDMRTHRDLGQARRFDLVLSGFEPMILALSPRPVAAPVVVASAAAGAGDLIHLAIAYPASNPMPRMAVRISVSDPHGHPASLYSGVLRLDHGRGGWDFPLAVYDPVGTWHATVSDPLGQHASIAIEVAAPIRQ